MHFLAVLKRGADKTANFLSLRNGEFFRVIFIELLHRVKMIIGGFCVAQNSTRLFIAVQTTVKIRVVIAFYKALKKLGDYPKNAKRLLTVWGVGYKFECVSQ